MTTVVLIGAGDIAVASALELRARGFDTAYVLTRGASDSGERACERLVEAGYAAHALRGDVGDWDSLRRAAEGICGKVAALVYSPAGDRVFRPFAELTQAEWDRSLDVFAGGLVGSVQAVLPRLARGGSVVALSGTSAHAIVSSRHLAMGSAKAAVEQAVRYLAATLAPLGVRVNAIASGPIETSSVVRGLGETAIDDLRRWQSSVTVPARWGQPADVGRIVRALCGPDLEWINGQVLLADGGASVALSGASAATLDGVLGNRTSG